MPHTNKQIVLLQKSLEFMRGINPQLRCQRISCLLKMAAECQIGAKNAKLQSTLQK